MTVGLVLRRRAPDEYPSQALLGTAFEFLHPRRDVLQFYGAEANEPLWIVAAILGGVVVESAEAGRPEFSVVEPVQEHPHRSVEGLRAHAVAILLLQTLGRIPHALGGGVKAVLYMFW